MYLLDLQFLGNGLVFQCEIWVIRAVWKRSNLCKLRNWLSSDQISEECSFPNSFKLNKSVKSLIRPSSDAKICPFFQNRPHFLKNFRLYSLGSQKTLKRALQNTQIMSRTNFITCSSTTTWKCRDFDYSNSNKNQKYS